MKLAQPNPGDIVVTNFGIYQHWSIVSDAFCASGKPMLISATKRNRTVKEEPWDVVTQGKPTYVAQAVPAKPASHVIAHARSQIGEWEYSLTSSNCEHFAKWASGLEMTSKQVAAGICGGVGGIVLVKVLSEKPTALKYLGVALTLCMLAVTATKVAERYQLESP